MKKWLYWIVFFLILGALVGWRFSQRTSPQGAGPKPGGGGGKAAAVVVAPTTRKIIVQTVQSIGNVESPFKIEISPKTGGRIDYLEAREGDIVQPGEVLLKINPSDLEGALVQQEASVAEARSRLAQAKLTSGATDVGISGLISQQVAGLASAKADDDQVRKNYEGTISAAEAQVTSANDAVNGAMAALGKENSTLQNVQSKFDRTHSLYAKGFLAAQDLDDAATAVQVQKGSVSVAQDQLASARSQLRVQVENLAIAKRKGQSDIAASHAKVIQAKAALDMATANRSQSPAYAQNIAALQSQVDAAIAQVRQAESRIRDTVVASTISGTVTARKADPGGLATPGQPVLEVQYLDWLYVTTTIPIDSGTQIHAGQIAKITIDGLPGQTFSGPIANINPAADPTNRQFGIKVRLENKDHVIRPGMYARVSVITGQTDAPVVVPREAVNFSKQDGTPTVTVVAKDDLAEVRPVTLGVSDDASIQVVKGVEPGEKVVILSYTTIRDGQKVSIGIPDSPGSKSKRNKKGKKGA